MFSVFDGSILRCRNSYSVSLAIVCSFVSSSSYSHSCCCDSERCGSLSSVIVCCLSNRGLDGMSTNNYRYGFNKCFCAFCLISISDSSFAGIACNAWRFSSGAVGPPLQCYCWSNGCLVYLYCFATGYGGVVVLRYLIVYLVCTSICVSRCFCKSVCPLLVSVFHYSALRCFNCYSVGLGVVYSFVSLCSNIHRCRCDSEFCGSLARIIVCCLCNRGLNDVVTGSFWSCFNKRFCAFCLISISDSSVSGISCNGRSICCCSVCPAF